MFFCGRYHLFGVPYLVSTIVRFGRAIVGTLYAGLGYNCIVTFWGLWGFIIGDVKANKGSCA